VPSPDPHSDTTLRLTRTFAAPRERVFAAWTDPEALKRWWDTPMFACVAAEADPRAGGSYRVSFRVKESGAVVTVAGTYREVTPPERLVYTWRWEEWEAETPDTLVTVEFREAGGGTELLLTHERFPDKETCDHHGEGWKITLDSLETGLADG